jgi:hypothetical protein
MRKRNKPKGFFVICVDSGFGFFTVGKKYLVIGVLNTFDVFLLKDDRGKKSYAARYKFKLAKDEI